MAAVMRSSPDVLRFQRVSPYVHVCGPAPKVSTATKIDNPIHTKVPPNPDQGYQHTPSVSPSDHPEPPKWVGPQGNGCRRVHDKAPRAIGASSPQRRIKELGLLPIFLFGEWDGGSTSCIVHTNRSATWASAFDPCLHAVPIRENRRGPGKSNTKRNALRQPQSQRSVSSDQLAEIEQPSKASGDGCPILSRRNIQPASYLFLSSMMVVELALNDGRSYETHSLPGTVAGRTTLPSFWNAFLTLDEGSTSWTPFGSSRSKIQSWEIVNYKLLGGSLD